MIHLGFTGTRKGMTYLQRETVRTLIIHLAETYGWLTVHHGACIGADAEFHNICMNLPHKYVMQIHQHLPRDPKLRAYLQGGLLEAPKDYDERNLDIVQASNFVIAAPLQEQPQIRGGTWQTIGFAQDAENLWRIVFPSGVAVKG